MRLQRLVRWSATGVSTLALCAMVAATATGAAEAAAPAGAAPNSSATATTVVGATNHFQATVYFPRGTARMTSSTASALTALRRRVPANAFAVSTTITGYVQRSRSRANDLSLGRARGAAVATRLRAAHLPGPIALRAGGVAGSVPASRRVTIVIRYSLPAVQSVRFVQPEAMTMLDPDQKLLATASSRLPVTLTSRTPATCAVVSRALHPLAAGVCTLAASQSGSTKFRPAQTVVRSVTISRGAQSIMFTAPADMRLDAADQALQATASSTLAVSFASTTPANCSVVSNAIHAIRVGTCTIVASQEGNGTYAPATPISVVVDITQIPFQVTFNANQGTGTMGPQSGLVPAALTSNSFSRVGYAFAGWNTAADGSGTVYLDGASFPFSASATLYAQWTQVQFQVTFNANQGTGTMGPQFGLVPAALTSNSFSRVGYAFAGWNTAADGSGTEILDGATYPFSANVTLYAQWDALD